MTSLLQHKAPPCHTVLGRSPGMSLLAIPFIAKLSADACCGKATSYWMVCNQGLLCLGLIPFLPLSCS